MTTSVCSKEQEVSWIGSDIYQTIPSMQKAREVVSEEKQKDVTLRLSKKLAGSEILSSLLAQIGTTPTHRSLSIKPDEVVVGVLGNEKILRFQARENSREICPITWLVSEGKLVATEGVLNSSSDVINVAKKVVKYANEFIPFLSEEGLSKLSLTIDPRLLVKDAENRFFIESSGEDAFIISGRSKTKEALEGSCIPAYLSTQPPPEIPHESSMEADCESWYHVSPTDLKQS